MNDRKFKRLIKESVEEETMDDCDKKTIKAVNIYLLILAVIDGIMAGLIAATLLGWR